MEALNPSQNGDRLSIVRSLDLLDIPSEDFFKQMVHVVADAVGAPIAYVSFADSEREWFKASHGLDRTVVSYEGSFARAIIDAGRPLEITDVRQDPRFESNPIVADSEITFFAGVPLQVAGGAIVGIVAAADFYLRELAETQWNALRDTAVLIQDTLERCIGSASDKAVIRDGDGIAITDASGQIVYQNEAYVRLFGYTADDLNREPGLTAHCKDPEAVLDIARKLSAGEGWAGDVEVQRKDGSPITVHLQTEAIKEPTGRVIGYIGIHSAPR